MLAHPLTLRSSRFTPSDGGQQKQCLRLATTLFSLVWLSLLLALASPQRVLASDSTPGTTLPQRVITLTPHITEILFAAGAGDYIVGTVSSSNYPDAALSITHIGDGMTLNNERVLRLHPDLIIGWREAQANQLLSPALHKLNIQLLYSNPQTLTAIADDVERFGHIFNTSATATPAAQALQARIQTLQQQYAQSPTVTVFLEVGTEPLYSIGNDSLWNDTLATCGARNFYADSGLLTVQASVEDILYRQPDLILTTQKHPQALQERLQYWQQKQLPAALAERVYALDADQLYRPGPRLIDATEQLCHLVEQVRATRTAP